MMVLPWSNWHEMTFPSTIVRRNVTMLTSLIAGVLFIFGCTSAATPAPSSTATSTPTPISPQPSKENILSGVRVEVVARNLEVPWALAFAPDGRLFVTERNGAIRVISDGQLLTKPFARLPVAATGESGLLGLAFDPDFDQNHYLYVYYTYRDNQGGLKNQVVRLKDVNGQGEEPKVLLDGIPGARIHDGGRIKFGPDGKLYITVGDAGTPQLAQDTSSLSGKILRINADGSLPTDNPFPGSPVYSYGHRNPQGLAWHPTTGQLFITEHGPSGHDEINLVEAGANYGWPEVAGKRGEPLFQDPVLESERSTWAPGGATFYSGESLPLSWNDKLLLGGLRGQQIHWMELSPPDYQQVQAEGVLFDRQFGRIRDVAQSPDGYIYFTTNNRDGRGNPTPDDDRILRIVPAR